MPDVRAAVLARCKDLEAHPDDHKGGLPVWMVVPGAREMVEIHAPVEGANGDGDDRVGCACGDADEFEFGTCGTLAALARMLGVDR